MRTISTRTSAGLAPHDRTGNARLDELIESFRASNVDRKHFIEFEWDPPVTRFAPGPDSMAMGNCGSLAGAFSEFLTEQHIEATTQHMDGEPWSGSASWDTCNYQAEAAAGISEACGHTVSLVEHDGARYMVDWTAAQFGCAAFPLVQHYVGGEWTRSSS